MMYHHEFKTRRAATLLAMVAGLQGIACEDRARTEMARNGAPTAPSSAYADGGWAQDENSRETQELEALGYLSGVKEAGSTRDVGVTIHDRRRSAPGMNLYVSGHGTEALLIASDGRTVHRWQADWATLFPDEPKPTTGRDNYWRKVWLLPDGDLLAIFDYLAIVRLDRDSRVKWARRNGAHHDLHSVDGTRVTVLVREETKRADFRSGSPTYEIFVVVLDQNGVELARHSVLDALLRSPYRALLDFAPDGPDVLHSNTLWPIPASRAPPWLEDGFLISLPHLNSVVRFEPEEGLITWALTGMYEFQHDPSLTREGTLLVFDNSPRTKSSRVMEIDPTSHDIQWQYPQNPSTDFYSACCSTAQRLENGNTLITVTDSGRAIEVDRRGEIVWLFNSPHRSGKNGELVARLWEVERVPANRLGWLSESKRIE